MNKNILTSISLTILSFSIIGQTNQKKIIQATNRLEEKHFNLPKTNSAKQTKPSQIYTLPFLQLDSSISENINADSSLYTHSQKKEFTYDTYGNINEETNYDWDEINNLWVKTTKKIHFYFSTDSLRSEENYEWDNNTLNWVPKNKHIYSYYINGAVDSNLFYTFNSTSLLWVGSNADIFVYDANDNVTNYNRQRWDTISNLWINEFKYEFSYNANNDRTQNLTYTWDIITDHWINSYKIVNTYDLTPNLTLIKGYVWDINLSQWQDDQKIALTYDANNNCTVDTSYTWNLGSSSWNLNELNNYAYDLSNNLTESTNSSWNTALLIWNSQNKYEYTYDLNNNKTTDVFSFWNGTTWELFFKTSFFNYSNSVAAETANYTWDANISQWKPIDKGTLNHNVSVSYTDIILPFYFEEDLFHHQLNTSQSYGWENNSSTYALNEVITYYYSNTSIGIKETQIVDNIVAFPNPTTDLVNFKLPKEETNYTIDVFNCAGAKLLSVNNLNKISVSDLNSGLYIYTITSKNNVYKGKFIKE
ncbi:MAG: T9SS type A sorting domain-containing protein [Bacteroidetes bacterium]|nr:T9SS type A sorting domain-containing protein [Bacteroidota bacterium]